LNEIHAVTEIVNDELLLDQLVQELFLTHVRKEFETQKNSIEENNNTLFNFSKNFVKHNNKLFGSLETMNRALDTQTRQIGELIEDALTHHKSLMELVTQVKDEAVAKHEGFLQQLAGWEQQCSLEQKSQKEQLERTQEYIIKIGGDIQEGNVIQATLIKQSEALSKLLMKQDDMLIKQLVAMREGVFAEMQNNRRWGMWGVGLTLVNMFAIAVLIVFFWVG